MTHAVLRPSIWSRSTPTARCPCTPYEGWTCGWSRGSSSPSWARQGPASPRCAHARRARHPHQRRDLARRQARRHALRERLGAAAPQEGRLRLPVLQPGRQHDRGRQRRAARAAGRGLARGRPRAPARTCSARSTSPTAPTPRPPSSRAASSSGSPWPARWPTSRACCWPTSPRATSTAATPATCSACSARCTRTARRSSWSPTTPGWPAWRTGWCRLFDGEIVDDGRIARRRTGTAGEVIDLRMEHSTRRAAAGSGPTCGPGGARRRSPCSPWPGSWPP